MYSLIWRILPGPWFVKLVLSCGLVAGAAALLWYVAFPEIAPHMPFRDSAVEVEEPTDEGDTAQSEEDSGADDTSGDGGGDNTGDGGDGDTGSEEDDEGIVGVDVPVGGEDD